jgi:hypothetical protein
MPGPGHGDGGRPQVKDGRAHPLRLPAEILATVGAGFAAFILLFPYSADDDTVGTCYAVFGYVVPCGIGPSLAAGLLTSAVVGGTLLAIRARRG